MKSIFNLLVRGVVLVLTLQSITLIAYQKDSSVFSCEQLFELASLDSNVFTPHKAWGHSGMNLADYRLRYQALPKNSYHSLIEGQCLFLAQTYVALDRLSDQESVIETHIKRLEYAVKILEEEAPKDENLSWAYLRIGMRLWYNQQYKAAEPWWQKAYEHSKKNGHKPVEIKALHHLGFIYVKERKLSLSKSHYKYLLSVIEQTPNTYLEERVLAINALGSAFHANSEMDSAIAQFRQGLSLLIQHKNEPSLKASFLENRALISHNLGSVLRKMGKHREAIKWLNLALESNESIYGKNSTQLLRTLRDIGLAYQTVDKQDLASSSLLRALQISKDKNYNQVKSFTQLAYYHIATGEYDTSLTYYDSALVANGASLNTNKDIYLYSTYLLTILIGQSSALANAKSITLNKLEKSYQQFNEIVRFAYGKTDSDGIFEKIPEMLENYYFAYNRLHKNSNDSQWLSRLWEIMELNKAVKLRNRLNADSSLKYAIPEQFLVLEKSYKDSIEFLMNENVSNEFDSSLFFIHKRYDNFLKSMEEIYPKYYALRNRLHVTSLQEVQNNMSNSTILYNFLEGVENIQIIRLSKKHVETNRVSRKELSQSIAVHNLSIQEGNKDEIYDTSQQIRDYLFPDMENLEHFRHIQIIPDGIIWNLNFSSIATENTNALSFLGNKFSFSYHYFAKNELKTQKPQPNKILAFSFSEDSEKPYKLLNSHTDVNTVLGPEDEIPGTSTEIKSISKIWEGKYYFARDANETTFKTQSGSYNVLHLAVHGFLDETKPENSYLKFAAADSVNDGKLHVYEIYNLDLNADLAVLSACHSGQGKIRTGEGMMSLGRAFAYAGVRSLLISRWEVSDYSAPHLMGYFYEGLKTGMYKSEALKYAQTEYLKNHADALTASPFYWSSFYVLGDDSPLNTVEASTGSRPWMTYFLIALALSALVAWARKKFKSAA